MPITKEVEVISVTVMPDGKLVEYSIVTVSEDGGELARIGQEEVVEAGDDLTSKNSLVKEIGEKVHTQARKDARPARDAS